MDFDNLLYYLLNLIRQGKQWQYQNCACSNKKPKLYFTGLQLVAIVFAFVFVCTKKDGLNNDIIDFLLSSLSIMTGLFFATIVLIYDKFRNINFTNSDNQNQKIKKIKIWAYLSQFNALISYAILIALLLIVILIGTLLFGHESNLGNVQFISQIADIDVLLTIQVITILTVRFTLVYFLFDFIILTIYAISSLFQLIHIDISEKTPTYTLNSKILISDSKTLHKEFGITPILVKLFLLSIIVLLLIYKFDSLKKYFEQLFL